MNRRLVLAVIVAMMAGGLSASAHNEYRIIGTIAKVSATMLDVKQTRDGKMISIKMDGETEVLRDKKTIARSELAAGLNVVVDACGDSLKDLVANEIRIVAVPARK